MCPNAFIEVKMLPLRQLTHAEPVFPMGDKHFSLNADKREKQLVKKQTEFEGWEGTIHASFKLRMTRLSKDLIL